MTSYNCICWFRVLSNQKHLAILAFFFACVPAVLLASIRSCTGNTGLKKTCQWALPKAKKQRHYTKIRDNGPWSGRAVLYTVFTKAISSDTAVLLLFQTRGFSRTLQARLGRSTDILKTSSSSFLSSSIVDMWTYRHGLGVGQRSSNFSDSDFLSKNSLSVALLVPASATPEFSQCSCSCQ